MTRRIGIGILAFLAVSLLGALVMSSWGRARRVERRLRLRLQDPTQAESVREALARRVDALSSLHGVSAIEMGPVTKGGEFDLMVASDQGRPLSAAFFQSLLSRGRVTFALVLEEGQSPPAGASVRSVPLSRVVFKLSQPTRTETETQTFRVVDPPALTVRGAVQCDYHTEGMLMEPVLTLRLSGEDAERLGAVSRWYKNRVFALLIGGQMACAARLQGPITDGRIQLRGMRDRLTIKRLKEMLEIGPLTSEIFVVQGR